MDILESAKKDRRWIEFLYPEWGWHRAYWNGGTWIPPREGNRPTACRELIVIRSSLKSEKDI